jgi:hypothetical protein
MPVEPPPPELFDPPLVPVDDVEVPPVDSPFELPPMPELPASFALAAASRSAASSASLAAKADAAFGSISSNASSRMGVVLWAKLKP